MYVYMYVCMHVCTKSFLKTTTNSSCVCTHLANTADSDSDSDSDSDQAAFTRQNSSKQICGWILMWETTGDALFHWRVMDYGLNDGFVSAFVFSRC